MLRKNNKTINDFLSHLPETAGFLMIDDLEKLLKNEQHKIAQKMRMLSELVVSIKQDCVDKRIYFNFHEVPENVIIKKKYSRKDYEETILKFLIKVRDQFLEEKALEKPEIPKE